MREFNRFETNFSEMNFIDENNQKIDINEVLNRQDGFKESISVGDLVRLKTVDYVVEIKFVNFNVPNLGIVDFAGSRIDEKSDDLVLFNRKDIECLVNEKDIQKKL